jgi:hypothetical protein
MNKQTQRSKQESKQTNKQTHKKLQVQEQYNFSLSRSGVTPSASSTDVGM